MCAFKRGELWQLGLNLGAILKNPLITKRPPFFETQEVKNNI